jgi:predicted nucleotidyltransferase
MNVFEEKRSNSTEKLEQLGLRLAGTAELLEFKDITIFATGSYARGEASIFSDIDLFFVNRSDVNSIRDRNTNTIRLFAEVIKIAQDMGFPKFSNDGAYLKIISAPSILTHLGDAEDDYANHFTTRLLMILESKSVYGHEAYDLVMRDVLGRYFEDYPDHPEDFQPTFLINDIIRFWKTLCLNYENKRNQPPGSEDARIAQKIKNLKLKFSRMLTCFGSVCYISSEPGKIGPDQLIAMTHLSPFERLSTAARKFDLQENLTEVERQYQWFLELTNVSEEDLRSKFQDKAFRVHAFDRAKIFGESVFEITKRISSETGYLRYLLV